MLQAKEIRVTADAGFAAEKTQWWQVQDVVYAPAAGRAEGKSVAELAQDARNMVTALGLYCDLLEEPGVLAAPFAHYGVELRLVAAASRRLLERLATIDGAQGDAEGQTEAAARVDSRPSQAAAGAAQKVDSSRCFAGRRTVPSAARRRRFDLHPCFPVANLAAEFRANFDLLRALAGHAIKLTMDADGCERAGG